MKGKKSERLRQMRLKWKLRRQNRKAGNWFCCSQSKPRSMKIAIKIILEVKRMKTIKAILGGFNAGKVTFIIAK